MTLSYHGRFAPTPSGDLHAGSLVAALASWLRARQAGGCWRVRVEDVDPPREVAGSAAAILADLDRLGLIADGPVLYQSTRHAAYAAAFEHLRGQGLIFPCWCSRTDLEAGGGVHRDGRCVTATDSTRPPAWRVRVAAGIIAFDDVLQGRQEQDVREAAGDFVLRRADGSWAYQLASVIDDAAQGITEVVRGADLIDSTARQIYLQRLLDLPTPRYLHIPLVTDDQGRKLSKSDADQPLAGQPTMALLRAALGCLGVPQSALGEPTPATLLAAAVRHFDIRLLARRERLLWPPYP